MDDRILEAIRGSAAIVTAGRRLARHLRGEFEAWPAPNILSWAGLVDSLWQQILFQDPVPPTRLSEWQERLLWERVIDETGEAPQLLQKWATAAAAREAWQLATAWRLDFESIRESGGDDARAFAGWARVFREECSMNGWPEEARLLDHLRTRIGAFELPKHLVLAGFDEITPQQQDLLHACEVSGCSVERMHVNRLGPAKTVRVGFADGPSELAAAARWYINLLRSEDPGRIAVIIPDLERRRDEVERIFRGILEPGFELPEGRPLSPLVNLSAGRALTAYPLVHAALSILGLDPGRTPWIDASNLLRNSFLAGAETERSSRAQLDVRMRKVGDPHICLANLCRMAGANRCPALARSIRQWLAICEALPNEQQPASWSRTFAQLLSGFGWPGERPLISIEYQTLEGWNELLSHFAAADPTSAKLSRDQAFGLLRCMAAEQVFQPETGQAPIQILGFMEASGLAFDHVWVAGLDDEAWPQPSRPNPFLPLTLQRAAGIPRCSPERELEFAERTTMRLMASAPDVVLSYPTRIEDRELTPSPLILGARRIDPVLTEKGTWRQRPDVRNGFPPQERALKNRLKALVSALCGNDRLRESLHDLRSLPADRFPESQWQALAALVRALPLAVAQLQIEFRERGTADYAEIAMAAERALGDEQNPTDLALALDYRVQHLLVDEFQDTSVSQYELLSRLTAGWEDGDGRTIFAVGDPMQSIYRFREAEVGIFLKVAKNGIGKVRPEVLQLTAHFRSDSGIVDWVNQVFPQGMPTAENITTGSIPYHSCEPVNGPGIDPAVTIHPFVERNDEAEAAVVVNLVRAARTSGRKVAILVRARSHLTAILAALRAAGLRFRAVEIDSLSTAAIVRDLTALTRALLHPADRIAWLAVLRAPWCGLTLAGFNTLAGDGSFPIWDLMHEESRNAALDPADRARLLRVRDALNRVFATRRLSPRAWVEGAWISLGGPACAEAAEDLEDAAAFFHLLEEMEEGGILDAAGFEEQIGKLFANPDALADDSIQVMSIHKAKGLEFDTVIVPSLGRQPRSDDSRLMLWLERPRFEGRPDLLLAPIHATGADEDTIYSYLKGIDARKAEHESGRLLYVAATRAKTELHLLGHTTWKEKDGAAQLNAPQNTSLLRRMWTAAQSLFEQALLNAAPLSASEPSSPERIPQTLERLPAAWSLPEPPFTGLISASARQADEAKPVSFYWLGDTLRHIGTVVHQVFNRIGQDGLEAWTPAKAQSMRPAFRSALASLGVSEAELQTALDRVLTAVTGSLADERGRWILQNSRSVAACEYPIAGVIDDRVVNSRVDRTFVDSDGTRWIIDYKTSFHESSGTEAFLDNELGRYRDQLTVYTRLFAAMEDRPVRAGLYFPLLGGWRELEMSFAGGEANGKRFQSRG